MKLVLVLDDRDPITVDADPEMTISDLRVLSCHEIGIPNLAPERIMLSYSGQQLKDLTQTLSTIGITENELLMVQVVPGGLSTTGDLSAIQSLAANLGRNRQVKQFHNSALKFFHLYMLYYCLYIYIYNILYLNVYISFM